MPVQHITNYELTIDDIKAGRCICTTTGRTFRPLSYKTDHCGAHTFVWAYCPICDTHRRTRADTDFDPLMPQAHAYELVQL